MSKEKTPTPPYSDGGENPAASAIETCPKTTLVRGKKKNPCPYLNKPFTVESSKANFDRIRKTSTLSKPTAIKYKFPGSNSEQDALEYEAEVDGRKKKLIMPKTLPSNKSLPTAQQLADAMGTVSGAQLDNIPVVVASPNPNPNDAYWAKQYNIPNFSSAATG